MKSDIGLEPYNWFSSTESGDWTYTEKGLSGGMSVAIGFMMIIFFGLMTTGLGQVDSSASVQNNINVLVDSLSALGIGLFYMVITLMFLIAWWIESEKPETRVLAVIDLGPTSGWVFGIPLGILLGVGFIFGMNTALGSFFPFETLTIFGINIEPIILILAPVIAIPIAEEYFFGGVMTPTLTQTLGIIPAAVLIGLIWILWHLGTYNTSIEILVFLFVFRIIATFLILYTKSLMPAIVAHIVINFAGTFFVI